MKYLILTSALIIPSGFLHAQTLGSFLGDLTGIINLIIPLIFAITFLTIAWGVIQAWIMGDASSDDVDRGKKLVFVGIIALTIMSAIWGIIRLLQEGLFG